MPTIIERIIRIEPFNHSDEYRVAIVFDKLSDTLTLTVERAVIRLGRFKLWLPCRGLLARKEYPATHTDDYISIYIPVGYDPLGFEYRRYLDLSFEIYCLLNKYFTYRLRKKLKKY